MKNTIFMPQSMPHLTEWHTMPAANDGIFYTKIAQLPLPSCKGNVRLLRRTQDQDGTRFVMSGKLSDVCAALDALAAQELRLTWRCAGA